MLSYSCLETLGYIPKSDNTHTALCPDQTETKSFISNEGPRSTQTLSTQDIVRIDPAKELVSTSPEFCVQHG